MPTTGIKFREYEYGLVVDEVNLDHVPETVNTKKYGPALGYTIDRLKKNYENANAETRSEMVRDYFREVIRFKHKNVRPQQMSALTDFFRSQEYKALEDYLIISGLEAKDFGRDDVIGIFDHAFGQTLPYADENDIQKTYQTVVDDLDGALKEYCMSSDLFWTGYKDGVDKATEKTPDWNVKRQNGIAPNYMRMYEDLTDIPSRLAFLVEIKKSMAACGVREVAVPEKELQAYKQIEDSFVAEYIMGASDEVRKTVFDTLGQIEGEGIYHYIKEYEKQKNNIPKEDADLRNEKAMWLVSKSGAGIDFSAISDVKAAFGRAIANDESLHKKASDWMKKAEKSQLKSEKLSKEDALIYQEMQQVDTKNLSSVLGAWPKKTGAYIDSGDRRTQAISRMTRFKEIYTDGKTIAPEDEATALEKAQKTYKSLGSMEEKLQFIIDCQINVHASEKAYAGMDTMNDVPDILAEQFIQEYMVDKGAENVQKAFVMMGKLSAESTIGIKDTYFAFRKEFEKEGKTGERKADYLMSSTPSAAKASAIRYMEGKIRSAINSGCKSANDISGKASLTKETTVAEYARAIGITDPEKIDAFVKKNEVKSDDKMVELIRKENPYIDMNFAVEDLRSKYVMDIIGNWMHDGFDKIVKDAGIDKEGKKELNTVREKLFTEFKDKGIKHWVSVEAKDRIRKQREETGKLLLNDIRKKYDRSVGYDQYIRLHTGEDMRSKDHAAQKAALAKSMAATMLKDSGAEFNVRRVRAFAAEIEKDAAFKIAVQDKELLQRSLCDPDTVRKAQNSIFQKEYAPASESVEKYIDQMKKLSENLMSPEGRSKEYVAFCKAVKAIGDLKGIHDLSKEGDRMAAEEKLVSMNLNLVITIQNYTLGKEKIRATAGGKERFDNTMDALAILSEALPEKKNLADRMVQQINEKRGAKPGSEKELKLQHHGLQRAIQAKERREAVNTAVNKGKQM